MKRTIILLVTISIFSSASLLVTGCAAWRAIMPGGVTPAMAEWEGIKSGPCLSIAGTIDPRAEAALALMTLLGQSDPLGVLMPVSMLGEVTPRWVLCRGEFAARCNMAPLNGKVHIAGLPIGSGSLWEIYRLDTEKPPK